MQALILNYQKQLKTGRIKVYILNMLKSDFKL